MQMSPTEPFVSFNSRYETIHRVAFGLSPNEQYNRTALVEYAKKLPQNRKEKLLQKIAKNNSYIKTLEDTFRQAIEINKESSFVDAASGRYSEQNATKIDTQINKLDDLFEDCDINAMSTRSTNRSADGSFNGSFNRSPSNSRNNSYNSPYNSSYNSRPNFRSNSRYLNNENSQNRQSFNKDNNRNRGHQQNTRYDQRNGFQNRYDNNQDRNRFENRG